MTEAPSFGIFNAFCVAKNQPSLGDAVSQVKEARGEKWQIYTYPSHGRIDIFNQVTFSNDWFAEWFIKLLDLQSYVKQIFIIVCQPILVHSPNCFKKNIRLSIYLN